ncbi:MAG: hypothetical protein WCE49_03830 [Terrimicrobiaceae bacterium]
MKRSGRTASGRNEGFLEARNIERQLARIRKELAWMRAEQEEMTRWIDSLRMDHKYDSPP